MDDGRGEFFDFGEFEVHCVFALWRFEDGHLFELFDAGLGFGGFGGVVAEFVDEGLEVGALAHLVFVLSFRGLAALFFRGVEGVEVGAFIVVESFGVLVDYICGDFVQEGSVVGDDEESRGVRLEVGGEEGDGGDVQHIGGFYQILAGFKMAFFRGFDHQAKGDLARKRELWLKPTSFSIRQRRSS